MSAEAAARLRKLWERLSFAEVTRTIARVPEDVMGIRLYMVDYPSLLGTEEVPSRRPEDIPPDRRGSVSWKFFSGFAGDAYFDAHSFRRIDDEHDFTLDFGTGITNFTDGRFKRPADGTLICGATEQTEKGLRFKHWFVCDPAFKLLAEMIRGQAEPTPENLEALRASDNLSRGGVYWAIAQLVLFDNVEVFAVEYINYLTVKTYNRSLRLGPFCGTSSFVHCLSRTLEPRWWSRFCELTAHGPDGPGAHTDSEDTCQACGRGGCDWPAYRR
jgi:hypothetical protein